MVNLSAWLGLMRGVLPPSTPILLYMHENQLTYPWRPGEKPDLSYAMINWTSLLCADQVAFNSRFHLESWFEEAPRLVKHFPDYNHLALIDRVREKSFVLPVGIDCARVKNNRDSALTEPVSTEPVSTDPGLIDAPVILWNQRWEYDKRPDRFFDLLYRLQAGNVRFRLVVAGENFRNAPAEFEEARVRLAGVIDQWGYVESDSGYADLLRRADLVISTADHEFFGISILEAIVAGVFPLLPNRLSYPELIPLTLHAACLYESQEELYAMCLQRLSRPRPAPPSLVEHVIRNFDWPVVAAQLDEAIGAMQPVAQ